MDHQEDRDRLHDAGRHDEAGAEDRAEDLGRPPPLQVAENESPDQAQRQAIEKQADAYLIKAAITPQQLVEFLSQIDTN